MNDRQIDRLVEQAQPRADAIASLVLDRGGQELLEEIMSTPVASDLDPQNVNVVELSTSEVRPSPPRRRRQALIGLAAAVAVAAAVAGPTLALRGGNDVVSTPASNARQAQEVAVDSPRVLLDDPTWKLDVLGDVTADQGQLQFTKGNRRLDVFWDPADRYQDRYDDRLDVSKPVPLQVLGRAGMRFRYDAADFEVLLPPEGKSFLTIRGAGGDQTAFTALVARLKQVSVEEWLATMPPLSHQQGLEVLNARLPGFSRYDNRPDRGLCYPDGSGDGDAHAI